MRELGPDDYDWSYFQGAGGEGRRDGFPKFIAGRHRVFSLVRHADDHHCVREAACVEINEWLIEIGWDIDGWHSVAADGERMIGACWRFRAGQEAEAEMFARRFIRGAAITAEVVSHALH